MEAETGRFYKVFDNEVEVVEETPTETLEEAT